MRLLPRQFGPQDEYTSDMIVEMHCHTSEHSPCSHVPAVDLVRRACEAGVQTIVLTDHHYQWSEEELADLRRRAQLPEVCQILAGQEVATYDFGHLLIYYFPKIQMGDSEEFWRILVEAERSLAAVAAGEGVGADSRTHRR